MKLKTRFALLTGLLVVLIIIIFNIIFFFSEKDLLSKEIKNRELAVADNFFTLCQDAVVRRDDILILNYIKGLQRTQPGVRYAYLMEPSGLILTLYPSHLFRIPDRTFFQNVVKNPVMHTSSWTDDDRVVVHEIIKPMIDKNALMGISVIGFSDTYYKKIFAQSIRNLQNRIFGISIIMLALGLSGTYFLTVTMLNPIKNVIQGVRAIGKGELNQQIEDRDQSELSELIHEFNRMALNLKELDDLKKHFIASVSHELRSPLNAIEGHIDFLIEELYTNYDRERFIDILQTIKKNTTRLSGFINNILDLSKMESGKLDLDIEPLFIANFAEEVIELYAPLSREKNITVQNNIPFKRALKVNVDRSRLRQIFNNLIHNAIKYTPEGGTIALDAQTTGNFVEVTVRDSGVGIPLDKQTQIFDSFMQIRLHREDVGNVKGTGLGLTIVKGLVEAHGGTMRVDSTPGKGSAFIFTLQKG